MFPQMSQFRGWPLRQRRSLRGTWWSLYGVQKVLPLNDAWPRRTSARSMPRSWLHNLLSQSTEEHLINAGIALNGLDFENALSQSRAAYSQSIGAPSIPNVSWEDVGGLASVKSDILDTIQLPLEHPELFGSGLKKRSGQILLSILSFQCIQPSARYLTLWSPRDRQDSCRKSCSHIILSQLFFRQRTRASEHVHW